MERATLRGMEHRPLATRFGVWWLPLAVSLLTVVTFAPAIHCGFINWDDPDYVLNNRLLRDLSPGGIRAIAGTPVQGNYHPLTILSLAVDYHVWKLNPAGYHLTNVVLHVLATLAVFWLIFLLTGSRGASAITSLFFGVHPVHVESVAWVSARKDVLYALFYLLACASYVRWTRTGRRAHYALTIACFGLSLLSKALAVALPLTLIAIDFYLRRPPTAKTLWLEKAPFYALAVVFGVIAVLAQRSQGAAQEFTAHPFYERALVACHSVLAYLIRAIVPIRLSAFYPYPPEGGLPLQYFLAPVTIALLGWAIAVSARVDRVYLFCGAVFLVNVAFVLQLYPIGSAAMADRYTYVPYVGVGMALAVGYRALRERALGLSGAGGPIAALALVAALAGLMLATHERIKVWRSNISLWTDVLDQYPGLPLGYTQRAWSLHEAGDDASAMQDLGRALSLEPENPEAHLTRGTIYFGRGEYREAVADLDVTVRVRPKYASARNNRGLALLNLNETDRAIEDFSRAIELQPRYTEAYLNRALAWGVSRQFGKAVPDLDRAIALDPTNAQAHVWRGVARIETGDVAGGIRDYDEALRLAPRFGQAYFARSNAYETLGRIDEALRDALQARDLGYRVPEADLERLRAGASGAAPPR